LLEVYRLLGHEAPGTEGNLVRAPRNLVKAIRVVCLCLDEWVSERMKQLRDEAAALEPQGVA
jgi:hypothetical protein